MDKYIDNSAQVGAQICAVMRLRRDFFSRISRDLSLHTHTQVSALTVLHDSMAQQSLQITERFDTSVSYLPDSRQT